MSTPTTDADAQAERELVEEIVTHWRGYAAKVALRECRGIPWLVDDAVSLAHITLLSVARSHVARPEPFTNLRRVVAAAVSRAVCRRIGQERVWNPAAFRRAKDERDDAGDLRPAVETLADVRRTHVEDLEGREEVERDMGIALGLLNQLTEAHAEAVLRLVVEGAGTEELAIEFGVSQKHVSKVLRRAIRRMQKLAGIRPEKVLAKGKHLFTRQARRPKAAVA